MVLDASEVVGAVAATNTNQENSPSPSLPTNNPTSKGRVKDAKVNSVANDSCVAVSPPRANANSTTVIFSIYSLSTTSSIPDAIPGDVDNDTADHNDAERHRFQLMVQPLVKYTVRSRDTLAAMLDVFDTKRSTFSDIMHMLWEQFGSRVYVLVLKQDDMWSIETPTEIAWYKAMQLKWNRHLVPTTKI
ncbi:LOW QUALITY PROTEIN: hypothetical protein PHMEG_00025004 [Phytophthora megakarya]|uniref:Uncharacterized protein n=1 Tax=Phytophthora megakarya TaxID=4795 RepID=A0A225VD22_9STRA|nr:LOW QUALITY PROTEIN: hypothetical protein PHMEG_00025004 [Phytophthora megakarya]